MKLIQLNAIPNQSITINVGDVIYTISIKYASGIMCASISKDGNSIISGHRIVSGGLLLPYKYMESGNFVMITQNYEYPSYEKFGVSQFLFYVSQAELDNLRNNRPILDPNGGFPLRYKPSGYEYVYMSDENGSIIATEQSDLVILGG